MTALNYDYKTPTTTSDAITYQILKAETTRIFDLQDTLLHLQEILHHYDHATITHGVQQLLHTLVSDHPDHPIEVKLVVSILPK